MQFVCPAGGTVPTLILFKSGVEVARQSGAVPTGQLLSWIRQHIA